MIALRNLQKVIDQATSIDISEMVAVPGEVTAVLGLTGLEKQTFIELLTGQTQPTVGTVRLAEFDPFAQRRDFATSVGVLPEENGLYPKLSVRQNLNFYCDLYGVKTDQVSAILQKVGLQDQSTAQAEKLTPSLARRLAFGRSILHNPSILILIDPFVHCNGASIALLKKRIVEVAQQPSTILMITADRSQTIGLCQSVVEFENGRFLKQYRPEETQPTQSNLPFKIPARLDGKVAFVNPADILYATTEDGRTILCTEDSQVPTHLTLSEVEERLSRSGFFRAHRAYLVNIQHIKEVISYTRNSYTLILDGTTPENGRIEIPLSKGAARELREMLDY